MATTTSRKNRHRSETISLCVSPGQKALIDQAALVLGRNRSDFVVECGKMSAG